MVQMCNASSPSSSRRSPLVFCISTRRQCPEAVRVRRSVVAACCLVLCYSHLTLPWKRKTLRKTTWRILFVILLYYILWPRTSIKPSNLTIYPTTIRQDSNDNLIKVSTSRIFSNHSGDQELNSSSLYMTEKLNLNMRALNFSLMNNTAKTQERGNSSTTCHLEVDDLGPIEVNTGVFSEEFMRNRLSWVQPGGRYHPAHCVSKHKVAVLVPFRNRHNQLMIFLNNMHNFLSRQLLDYGIFVVQQVGNKSFNRGKLFNVGFLEAQRARAGGWSCVIPHDVDLLPLHSGNVYNCSETPRHLSYVIDNYKTPEDGFLFGGGASSISTANYMTVNGYSNRYWGWGGEDDDLQRRLAMERLNISRYPKSIARYTMLEHKEEEKNTKRFELLNQTNETYKQDGLSSVKYELVQIDVRPLYTRIKADIDEKEQS